MTVKLMTAKIDLWPRATFCNLGRAIMLAIILVATPASAAGKRGYPETPSTTGQALFDLKTGFQRLSAGDARGAIELLNRAIDSDVLPEGPRGSAYFFRAAALREQGKFKEAVADLDEAARLTPDKPQIPVLAFDLSMRMEKLGPAYDYALKVAKQFPPETASLDLQSLYRILATRKKDDALTLRAALFDAGYRGSPRGIAADEMFRELVTGYLDRNDIVNAIRVAEGIVSVDVLVDMMIDKRFEEVWPAIGAKAGEGFVSALKRQREMYQEIVKEQPDDVDAVHHLIDTLRLSGQSPQAIKLGTKVLDDPVALGNDPEAYFWVLTKTAYADTESAKPGQAMQRMAELKAYKLEDYPELVSQHINRGALLLDLGQFAEASAAARLADTKYLSNYGRMWVRAIDMCAAIALKQKPDTIQPFLDILKDNGKVNPSAYAMGLLCANKTADAEQWYIKRLSDSDMRSDALQALQIYAKGDNEGSHYAMLQDRLAQVRNKSSIKKAIDKAGRQLTISLPRGAIGNY
jgi:tetratricopeptide (TPR) repeat protein